jgi:hypothetical protein
MSLPCCCVPPSPPLPPAPLQHNLPSLPNFVRAFNGTLYSNVPHLLEPLWSYLPEFIGDDFYRSAVSGRVAA